MPVESVTTPKRIHLVYQNVAKMQRKKLNKKPSTGELLVQLTVLLKIQLIFADIVNGEVHRNNLDDFIDETWDEVWSKFINISINQCRPTAYESLKD